MFKWFREWKKRRLEKKARRAFNKDVQDEFKSFTPSYTYEFKKGRYLPKRDEYAGYTVRATAKYHAGHGRMRRFTMCVDSITTPMTSDTLKTIESRWHKREVKWDIRQQLDGLCLDQIYRDFKFKTSEFGQACDQVMSEDF